MHFCTTTETDKSRSGGLEYNRDWPAGIQAASPEKPAPVPSSTTLAEPCSRAFDPAAGPAGWRWRLRLTPSCWPWSGTRILAGGLAVFPADAEASGPGPSAVGLAAGTPPSSGSSPPGSSRPGGQLRQRSMSLYRIQSGSRAETPAKVWQSSGFRDGAREHHRCSGRTSGVSRPAHSACRSSTTAAIK